MGPTVHKDGSVSHKTGLDETISVTDHTEDYNKTMDKNHNISDTFIGNRTGGSKRVVKGLHSSGYVCIGKTCQGLMNLDFDALEDTPKHKHHHKHHHSKKREEDLMVLLI